MEGLYEVERVVSHDVSASGLRYEVRLCGRVGGGDALLNVCGATARVAIVARQQHTNTHSHTHTHLWQRPMRARLALQVLWWP